MTYREALGQALAEEMERDEDVFLMGEEVGLYNGAYKVSKGLLKAAIRDDDPVVVMEGELLYALKGEVPDDDDFVIPLGVADVKKEGTDVSIITHGKMVH